MELDVTPAAKDEQAAFLALMQLYAYDLSETLDMDVRDDGRYRVPSIEAYFVEPNRHAFVLRVSGKIAGFALVHQGSRLTGDPAITDMAEFFVLKKYRRRGVGERAATALFDRFPGKWEVREKKDNTAATAFWRKIIGRYTGERFKEEMLDDERWRGPVQRFEK